MKTVLTGRAIIPIPGQASHTTYDNSGSGLTASNLQAAIDELAGEIPTAGTPALTLSTTNSAGSASTFVATDATVAAFDVTVPVTQAFGDAAATGSTAKAARRDHKHGMPANPVTTAALSALGYTGGLLLSSDHATPIVFDDILQASDGADFLYASEP